MARMEEGLLLFFTGYARESAAMLRDQAERAGSDQMQSQMEKVSRFADYTFAALESGNLGRFGYLMDCHWQAKRERTPGMTNDDIDKAYVDGLVAGAKGGKLVGAGAGGFLMFYTEEPARLRAAMAAEGLAEVRFRFDHDGSTVIARGL